MIRANKKVSTLEEQFQVEPPEYFVEIRKIPNTLRDAFSSIYRITTEPSEHGPFSTLMQARTFCLQHHKETYPTEHQQSLSFNSREELLTEGFELLSQNYLLLTLEGYKRYMAEQRNFTRLPMETQDAIREKELLAEALREERVRQQILDKPEGQRSRRERLFLNNLELTEEHAQKLALVDPFYLQVLERISRARELISKNMAEVKK